MFPQTKLLNVKTASSINNVCLGGTIPPLYNNLVYLLPSPDTFVAAVLLVYLGLVSVRSSSSIVISKSFISSIDINFNMRYIPCDLILSSLCCYHRSFSFFHNQHFGSKAGVNLFLHSCFTNTFVPIDKSIFFYYLFTAVYSCAFDCFFSVFILACIICNSL